MLAAIDPVPVAAKLDPVPTTIAAVVLVPPVTELKAADAVGVAQVASPRQKVVELAPVPLFKFVTGIFGSSEALTVPEVRFEAFVTLDCSAEIAEVFVATAGYRKLKSAFTLPNAIHAASPVPVSEGPVVVHGVAGAQLTNCWALAEPAKARKRMVFDSGLLIPAAPWWFAWSDS